MVSLPGLGSFPAISAVVLALAVQSCSAAMAAWWTTIGPQLIRQNLTTGEITYSLCSSNDTPIYPTRAPSLSLTVAPKNGTALAGAGWWNEKTTFASIFYQSRDGEIVNSFHECDFTTGRFKRKTDVIISGQVPSVHSDTGLATVNLGAKLGYRLYYHDADKAVNTIGFDPSDSSWYHAGTINREVPSGMAIAAQFTGTNNVSVVTPRDSQNVGITRYNNDTRWWIASTPRPLVGNYSHFPTNVTNTTDIRLDTQAALNFSLAGWTGNPSSLGIAIDSKHTRSIFWIGTDRALHQIANINYVWGTMNLNISRSAWPLADDPNAELALTSEFYSSVIRIYYYVGGALTEVKQEPNGGTWTQAQALPARNLTAPTTTPESAPSSSGGASTDTSTPIGAAAAASSELSAGAKAGIGVGVAFGVLAIAGAGFGVWLVKRRQAAAAAAEAEADEEEERQRQQQAALLAASQQQQQGGHHQQEYLQQYYYDSNGAAYPAPYGSPPPPATPFSDNGSQGGGPYGWPLEKQPEVGPPQELHNQTAAQELHNQTAAQELPEQRLAQEMNGGRHPQGPQPPQ